MDAVCTDAHLYSGRFSYFIPRLNPNQTVHWEALSADREVLYVYALLDPRDDRVRYIGCSVNPANRIHHHIYSPHTDAIGSWTRELRGLRLKPRLVILDQHRDQTTAQFLESRLIAEYEAFQGGLLNRMVEFCGRGKAPKRNKLVTGRYRDFLIKNAFCLYPLEVPAHTVSFQAEVV